MNKKRRLQGVVLLVFAALFFIADIFAIIQVADFYAHSEKAIGVVTHIRQVSKGGNRGQGPTYEYTISFCAENGATYSTTVQHGNYEVGDEATVSYDSRNPREAAASFWYIWIFVIICSLGSLIFFALGYGKLKPAKPLPQNTIYQTTIKTNAGSDFSYKVFTNQPDDNK